MNDSLLVIRQGAVLANESVVKILIFTFSIKIPSTLYMNCWHRTKMTVQTISLKAIDSAGLILRNKQNRFKQYILPILFFKIITI